MLLATVCCCMEWWTDSTRPRDINHMVQKFATDPSSCRARFYHPTPRKALSPKSGLYLLQNLDIGKTRYSKLKMYLEKWISLPNYQEVSSLKHEIIPEYGSTIRKGLWCPLRELLPRFTRSLLENLTQIDTSDAIATNGNSTKI